MAEETKNSAKKMASKITTSKEKIKNVQTKLVETLPKKEAEAKSLEVPAKKENAETQKETIEKKAKAKPEILKVKDKAIVNAYSLKISLKHSKFICKMIKRKTIPHAIKLLENVVKGKQPVKMTGLEVGHQKGKGISGARFPKNASNAIIDILKQLKANSIVNGIEEPIITIAMANQASAPFKKGGRRAKRAHLHFEAQDKTKLINKNKK